MKSLDPTIPALSGYSGEHWRLAAGIPANIIFTRADRIQFVCAGLGLMTLGFWLSGLVGLRQRGEHVSIAGAVTRIATFSGAMGGLCYQLFILGPRMNLALKQWLAAANTGDSSRAEAFRAAFDADHPAASRTLGFTSVCVAACLVTHLWAGTGGEDQARRGRT